MALHSGSYWQPFVSGSESNPAASGTAGAFAGAWNSNGIGTTQGDFTPTYHFGNYFQTDLSGSEANPHASGAAGHIAGEWKDDNNVPKNQGDFTPTYWFGNYHRSWLSGNLSSHIDVDGIAPGVQERSELMVGGLVGCLISEDTTPPFTTNNNPSSGSILQGVDKNTSFLFDDAHTNVCMLGGKLGLDLSTIHIQFRVDGGPLVDAVISGTFQPGYDGPGSSFTAAGTNGGGGLLNGYNVVIDRTTSFPGDVIVRVFITGSDVFGNTHTENYPWTTVEGCPDILPKVIPDPGDYTIVKNARALFEHETSKVSARCDHQQAPFNMAAPGTARLRTGQRAPYTSVNSSQAHTNKNGTELPLGETLPD